MSERESVARKRQGIVPPMAPKKRVCPECGGIGYKRMNCPKCQGIGYHFRYPRNAYHKGLRTCEDCLGERWLYAPCSHCHGTGKVEEVEDAE